MFLKDNKAAKRAYTMSLTILRFTEFQVQRLQCIGGQSRATPYRITTYHGMEIGTFGKVAEAFTEASNSGMSKWTALHGLKRFLSALTD